MKRLAIIVPYRERRQHLDQFVPHMRAYFARDKLDKDIDYRVLIVEQEAGLPFNRGALKNAGFLLAEVRSDYCCFHDIDYLPIWADYSPVDRPTPIVWYGAEERPIAPGRTNLVAKHNLDTLNFTPADLSFVLDTLDGPYLPLLLLEAAGVPLDSSFEEQKKILQRCNGLFYACKDGPRRDASTGC